MNDFRAQWTENRTGFFLQSDHAAMMHSARSAVLGMALTSACRGYLRRWFEHRVHAMTMRMRICKALLAYYSDSLIVIRNISARGGMASS